jgi:hypothetical protein
MNERRLVPSKTAWSPVGYQVVEIPVEPVIDYDNSPYRLVPTAEERTPEVQLPRPLWRRRRKRPPPRTTPPWTFYGAAIGGGLVAVAILVACLSANRSPNTLDLSSGAQVVQVDDAPRMPAEIDGRRQVILPPEILAAGPAADDRPAPIPAAGELCDATERQTFGTFVEFVRNPQEAERVAAREHRLTYLLHVSGNFEESRFT